MRLGSTRRTVLVTGAAGFIGSHFVYRPQFDPPVNLGDPGEFTMFQLAQVVMKVADYAGDVTYMPLPADDPKRRCPDISKARRLLGFQPKVALEDGIRLTYANFAARIAAIKRAEPKA
jgi:UDP-glucuronate decarboxylase